ncbi:hypothetical protein EW026_g8137 [Hermanssonia centrifuga]|uniref:Protein kinase domain-containing protein n=1 Tax=Hermanssonia centrifuga TaxID=98765 RepID=A0A4S4K5E2_9APHY|nr:hypothetical protein EW026_g8137 [Hermanssonia centrifuga]
MVDQILDCLHDLRYKAHILHRDISCNNIMYEIRDGKLYFILIDFDLAAVVTSAGELCAPASAKDRTGTLPFMAHELLTDIGTRAIDGIKHRLRHDYESLLYVSCWSNISMPVVEDEELKTALSDYLRTWEADTLESVRGVKCYLMRDRDGVASLLYPPAGEHLRPVFNKWFKLFRQAYNNWSNILDETEDEFPQDEISKPEPDVETLNGFICRDTIKKAIAEGMAATGLSLGSITRRDYQANKSADEELWEFYWSEEGLQVTEDSGRQVRVKETETDEQT